MPFLLEMRNPRIKEKVELKSAIYSSIDI